ncbi:MAG: hypothetical protein E3J78_02170 [Candidatus Cloacimonadota bacterium]|nr:MAG: hypothetical protein E3J78_02170 [Candidatus Cloacimonadota bacterium]
MSLLLGGGGVALFERLMMRKYLVLLIIFAVLVRIPFAILVFNRPHTAYASHDSIGYDALAKNLLYNHSFSLYSEDPQIKDPVRTPGYPFFLSMVYVFFPDNSPFVVLFQMLLDIGIILLLFNLVRAMVNDRAGFIAGLFYALNIHQVLFTTQVLSEILFSFFLLAGIVLCFLYVRKRGMQNLFLSALCIGFAILIRPIALFFPLIILFFLMLKRIQPRRMVAFTLIVILFPLTWTLRNTIVFKQFFYTKIHSVNLVLYHAPSIIQDRQGISREEAKKLFFKREKEKYSLSDYQMDYFDDNPSLCDKLARDARGIVFTYPLLFIKHQILGVIHTLLPANMGFTADMLAGKGSGGSGLKPAFKPFFQYLLRGRVTEGVTFLLKERGKNLGSGIWMILGLICVYQIALYILSIFGLKRNRISPEILFILITIAYFMIIPGEVGEARFRVPVEPYITLLASLALVKQSSKAPSNFFTRKDSL